MNIVQSESYAFILPDDMDAFRKRYNVEIICIDFEDGVVLGIGPNDKDWRELPDTETGARVVSIRSSRDDK